MGSSTAKETLRVSVLAAAALLPLTLDAKCYEDRDKFAGTVTHWCAAGGLSGDDRLAGTAGLDPLPIAIVREDGSISVGIRFVYRQPSWLFIEPGAKLVFILDGGERIELVSEGGSLRNRETMTSEFTGPMVREEAAFVADAETIRRIGSAETVEYGIYGGRGRVEEKLSPKARKPYLELYEKVLSPPLAKPP